MSNEDLFTKKLIQLLLDQQERAFQRKQEQLGNATNFKSVGEILGTQKYQKHLEKKWKKNK